MSITLPFKITILIPAPCAGKTSASRNSFAAFWPLMENQPAVGFPLPFPPMRCSFRGISHEVQTECKNAGGVFDERAWRAKVFRVLRDAIKTKVKLISPCGGRGNQRGIPQSADGGQHTHFIRARRGNKDSGLRAARLDCAGPQARTRLSPAGGNQYGARAGVSTVLWFFIPPSCFRDRCHPRGSNNPRRLHAAGYNHRRSGRYAHFFPLPVPAGHRPECGYYCRNGSR